MTVIQASNIKLTCIKAGADGIFTAGDDILDLGLFQGGGSSASGHVTKTKGHLSTPSEYFDGDTGRVTSIIAGGSNLGNTFNSASSITFNLVDRDPSVFDKPDDPLLQTTYFQTGNEPLVGQSPFFFVNVSNQSGSKWKLEYNIAKFPTTGKLASEKGGVLNGKNTDGTLVGQGGKDIIYANDGDDIVLGRGGNDKLYGGKGSDVVWGGKGYDQLSGGAGKDTFVVAQKTGLDTITDFRVGTDKIGLAYGLEYQDVSVWQKTGGSLLKAGSEQLAFLEGVNANQLGKSSFAYSDLASVNSLTDANLTNLAVA